MAKKKQSSGGNVAVLPQSCPVDACGKKPKRAGFCEDHFVWFKAGLVNRQGQKPSDFDKKFQAFNRKNAA